jgi:hypothetical protein
LSTIEYQKSNFELKKISNELKGFKIFLHYFGNSIQLKGHFSVNRCTIDPKMFKFLVGISQIAAKLYQKLSIFFSNFSNFSEPFFEKFEKHFFLKNSIFFSKKTRSTKDVETPVPSISSTEVQHHAAHHGPS